MWLLMILACGSESKLQHVHEAPEVQVAAPTEGQIFRQGQGDISLSGSVKDSYDVAADLIASWSVDGGEPQTVSVEEDGTVGLSVEDGSLEIGPHTVTLQGVDTDGDTDQSLVNFQVAGPLGAPEVHITAPMDGTVLEDGVAVTFTGDASDATTPASDLVFRWISSISGELPGAISADGQSVLPSFVLESGDHLITLEVTDGDGETGSATINVSVNHEIQPGDLVFSELMVDPQVVDDTIGEWVELYNTSSLSLDIGGYTFRDDDVDSWVLEGPLVVAGHDYVVLCANMDAAVNGGVPCDAGFHRDSTGGGMALANGPDEVVLARPDGIEIDWLHYDETWYVAGVAIGVDPQYRDGNSNDDVSHWCPQHSVVSAGGEPGTPGEANDACEM